MPPVLTLTLLAVLVAVALRARAVTISGAATGAALGALFVFMPGHACFTAFALFVVAGSAASKIGLATKESRGIAQERGGARGAGNALANVGFAGLAALAHHLDQLDALPTTLAICGSLAAALSDTVSSEVGQAFGGRPFHVTKFRRVPWGTDGAVSLMGTAAGALAAAALAALCLPSAFLAVALGGLAGNLTDTFFGATLEPRLGRYGNATVNFLGSAAGGCVAVLLA